MSLFITCIVKTIDFIKTISYGTWTQDFNITDVRKPNI